MKKLYVILGIIILLLLLNNILYCERHRYSNFILDTFYGKVPRRLQSFGGDILYLFYRG